MKNLDYFYYEETVEALDNLEDAKRAADTAMSKWMSLVVDDAAANVVELLSGMGVELDEAARMALKSQLNNLACAVRYATTKMS